MKRILFIIVVLLAVCACNTYAQNRVIKMAPGNGESDVNIDTHLVLTMAEEATVGQKGFVSVYDKKTGRLVDCLDMSIPAGPTEGQPKNPTAQYTPIPYIYKSQHITNRNTKAGKPSGVNAWDKSRYQLDIIGGFSDGFHFYPIISKGKQLTIYLHHNMLEYGHEYYITIDKGVIEGFNGIKGKKGWTFRTKDKAPDSNQRLLTVAADGTGDFSTVQGAMDFIPDSVVSEKEGYRVFVKNGDYEELVYFRNKRFVTIEGESRDGVMIHYRNNEVFNPHPVDIKTNEVRGTFPSRRAAFAADNCSDLVFHNLTLKTDCKGQAEGLLVNGERNFFENIHVIGDGDALQANGSCYWLNCRIDGGGDTILGRGPSFFNHCTITSYGAFMWIRNTEENHGNVFVDCHLKGLSEYAEIGRLPDNKGKNYPHAECVLLNCTLENIPAYGWGRIDGGAKTATILEFNSHNAEGHPIDISKRNPQMRQLDPIRDAQLIGKYSDSHWVLGWDKGAEATKEHRELIKQHIYGDYKQMYRQPTGIALIHPYLTPGSKQYASVLWDWDSWLSDVALRQTLNDVGSDADRKEALVYEQGCVLNYLAYTSPEDGYMPMVVDAESDPNKIKPADIYKTNMHKPCLAQHAAFLVKQTGGNAEWLREGYPRMQAFVRNYHDHHRHAETGLYYWQDDLAIGVDNDPSTFFRPKGSSASIYLNCLMYKELRAMSYLAGQLQLADAKQQYTLMADSLRDAVREWCWDEKDGMYYSVDLNLLPYTGEPQIIFGKPFVLHKGAPRHYPCLIQRIGCWSGFMTLWAGIATPEQARRMVKENLMDERTFCGTYGVRTLSKLEKMYNLRATNNPSNWQGPLWGISNYMVWRGLADYGLNKEARMMAEKTIALFGEDLKKNGALHEYYDPDTGEPIMNPGFQNWNYLVLNMVAWIEGRNVVHEF